MTTLDIVLFLPLIGFLVMLFTPKDNASVSRWAALAISVGVFVVSLALLAPYWFAYPTGYTFETNHAWINYPPIHYHVGLDGLSLWLVLLSTFLTPIAVVVSWKYIDHRVKEYFAFLILLEFGLIGVFVSIDLFLFYVFWEVALVPMYFLIGIWGHDRRIYATVKFFLFTMAGSVLMLGAIIYLYNQTGTFDYNVIRQLIASGHLALTERSEMLLFLAFFLAFAVKVPLFPLHTWLPDAHVEAPTAGSVMLASVMLKMGTYGLLRLCVPLFPNAAHRSAPWVNALAITGIIFGALVAMVQPNMKKLVAYSSVSHLGFVVLGIFSFTQQGLDGAVYIMLAHGISTGALFVLVGFLYERRHSLEISAYGGVATAAPNLAIVFSDHHARVHRTADAQQLRRRIPGAAGRGRGQLHLGHLRFPRRDSLRLLHAVALPASLFRKTIGIRDAPCVRPDPPRMGRDSSSSRPDVLAGQLLANLHARDHHAKCGHPPADADGAADCRYGRLAGGPLA